MGENNDCVELQDALHIVAVMGDLSMGQPMDHSRRVAGLVDKLARRMGCSDKAANHARQIALLRWSGCTANAAEIAANISDDVGGRAAMLALQHDKIELLVTPEALADRVGQIAAIHCEVSSLIASMLELDSEVTDALSCVFEYWDGSGRPQGLAGEAIPALALMVSLCSELEVFSRVHGLAGALKLLTQRAGSVYPVAMAEQLLGMAGTWLAELSTQTSQAIDAPAGRPVNIDLIGYVIDLKLPWLTGQSRGVVDLCEAVAAQMGLAEGRRATLRRAGWLHGLGRVAIPNAIWNRADTLTAGEQERTRLAPYWTARAGRQVEGLAAAAELASLAHERLDGSGYFRGLTGAALSIESRILAAAVAWVEHRSERPWRAAMSPPQAWTAMGGGAGVCGFDSEVLEALAACVPSPSSPSARQPRARPAAVLSAREIEVLRRVSLGDSNKLAAQTLGISPATVRTHMENIFQKLQCRTRAACTLRASVLGLLD